MVAGVMDLRFTSVAPTFHWIPINLLDTIIVFKENQLNNFLDTSTSELSEISADMDFVASVSGNLSESERNFARLMLIEKLKYNPFSEIFSG